MPRKAVTQYNWSMPAGHNRLLLATRILRYIILAAILAGAVRSVFFAFHPNSGPNLLVAAVLIWPFLIVAFSLAVVHWESKAKNTYIPFTILLLIAASVAIPSLMQSIQSL